MIYSYYPFYRCGAKVSQAIFSMPCSAYCKLYKQPRNCIIFPYFRFRVSVFHISVFHSSVSVFPCYRAFLSPLIPKDFFGGHSACYNITNFYGTETATPPFGRKEHRHCSRLHTLLYWGSPTNVDLLILLR